jgi:hypothetical protein
MQEGKAMAEAALFIGWGEPARGREKHVVDLFNQSVQYWGRLQQEGKIERFDVALLEPHGSDLGGFALLRGTAQQIDSVQREEEFQRLIARARLRLESLGVVGAIVDEELTKQMGYYQDEVGELDC